MSHKRRIPERVLLEGIPVPEIRILEHAGADRVAFQVRKDPPEHLGGPPVPAFTRPDTELVWFRRTGEEIDGLAVFKPDGQATPPQGDREARGAGTREAPASGAIASRPAAIRARRDHSRRAFPRVRPDRTRLSLARRVLYWLLWGATAFFLFQ